MELGRRLKYHTQQVPRLGSLGRGRWVSSRTLFNLVGNLTERTRLKSLAESIRQYGVLQPLVVTRKEIEKPDGSLASAYELIAGERRLRSSKLIGLREVPVVIRQGEQTDTMKLELAIIENLQREESQCNRSCKGARTACKRFQIVSGRDRSKSRSQS